MQQPEYDESEGEMMEDFREKLFTRGVEIEEGVVPECFGNFKKESQYCCKCDGRLLCKENSRVDVCITKRLYGVRNGKVVRMEEEIINPGEQKEMAAAEYFAIKKKMAKQTEYSHGCGIGCGDCPLSSDNNGSQLLCTNFEMMHPEEAIEIVQKWAEEHPEKTMLQDLLEKFPNTKLVGKGHPDFCPHHVGYESERPEICKVGKGGVCFVCWNRPLEVE